MKDRYIETCENSAIRNWPRNWIQIENLDQSKIVLEEKKIERIEIKIWTKTYRIKQ